MFLTTSFGHFNFLSFFVSLCLGAQVHLALIKNEPTFFFLPLYIFDEGVIYIILCPEPDANMV